MPDRFTLLTLSFSLILHNVCSFKVSEPLNHTLHEDDSISVTCMNLENDVRELEAKLIMNGEYVCKISNKKDDKCKWQHNGNAFTFTFKNPGTLHEKEFSCEISRIDPLPIITLTGAKIKLFRGCSLASPEINCSCSDIAHIKESTLKPTSEVKTPNEDMYTLLICGLSIVVVMLSIYSIILTVFYIRLRVTNPEPSDNLTYVPMQRNVKRRDPDNTEYVDMREVQKRGGSHRDMNHNSHLITI